MSEKALRRLEKLKGSFTPSSAEETPVFRTELTPVSFLIRSAAIFPNRQAALSESGELNYRQFQARVLRLAASLQKNFAVKSGDRVGLICRNVQLMLDAHFAIPAFRGIIVAFNTRLTPDDVTYITENSGCKVILYEPEFESLLASVKATCVPADDSRLYQDFNIGWSDLSYREGHEDDVIAISYTSGTTGRPKGVMTTYRGTVLACLNNALEMALTQDSRYLWVLPMFHCNGWCFPWTVAAVAGSSVLLAKADAGQIWHHLLNSGVTHYCGAPTVQISLCHHPTAAPLPRKVKAMIAGSPPSPTLLATMESLGLQPIHTYGLTETYGPCTAVYPMQTTDSAARYQHMAGQGYSYLMADHVRVVDAQMRDVPRDGTSEGEVVFRGNLVMKGYYNDPEATKEAFHGGWFHSGDIAVMEKDGSIALKDRKKDIIISGGENISTIEIEKALAQHAAVKEVAVVSKPHSKWGETPKAYIVLKNEALNSDPGSLNAELLAYARENLAHFKCPSEITFLKEFPKTGTGKIQKYILKQKEWAANSKLIG